LLRIRHATKLVPTAMGFSEHIREILGYQRGHLNLPESKQVAKSDDYGGFK
jgi:hypothetical protein